MRTLSRRRMERSSYLFLYISLLCLGIISHDLFGHGLLSSLSLLSSPLVMVNAATTTSSSTSTSTTSTTIDGDDGVMRPYNLDYLNVETLQYYIQYEPSPPRHEYDIAILYYAQWDSNSHSFAPLWDQIGKLLHAGSKESKLIMGLFDCEKNMQHVQVCDQAGVKHYPTITFYSLSGGQLYFHGKNQRKTKKRPNPIPRHGIEFSGNWQYGDAVYDWIRALSKLSSWHRGGWRDKIRSIFHGKKKTSSSSSTKLKDQPLPLGVPPLLGAAVGVGGGGTTTTTSAQPNTQSSSSSSSSAGAASSSSTTTMTDADVLQQLQTMEQDLSNLEKTTARGGILLGAILEPVPVNKDIWARVAQNQSLVETTLRQDVEYGSGKKYTDAFMFLNQTNGWQFSTLQQLQQKQKQQQKQQDLIQNEDLTLQVCVMELSLDYCTRASNMASYELIHSMNNWTNNELDQYLSNMTQLEHDLLQRVQEREPYCVLIESCIKQFMEPQDPCRPYTCPFHDTIACRYISSCFEGDIQKEQAKMLNVTTTMTILEKKNQSDILTMMNIGNDKNDSTTTTTTTTNVKKGKEETSQNNNNKKKKRGWGLW